MGGFDTDKALLGKPEQQLYARLVRAFPGHVILAQVAMARLLAADDAASLPARPQISHRQRHVVVDFAVCRPDFTVVAVVECDAPGRLSEAQRERIRRRDDLLRVAGIKVVHVPAADIPSEPALKALVTALPLNARAPLMRHAS